MVTPLADLATISDSELSSDFEIAYSMSVSIKEENVYNKMYSTSCLDWVLIC